MIVAKLNTSHLSVLERWCVLKFVSGKRAEVICLAGEPLHNLDFETCRYSHHKASASSLVISCNSDYLPYRVP